MDGIEAYASNDLVVLGLGWVRECFTDHGLDLSGMVLDARPAEHLPDSLAGKLLAVRREILRKRLLDHDKLGLGVAKAVHERVDDPFRQMTPRLDSHVRIDSNGDGAEKVHGERGH